MKKKDSSTEDIKALLEKIPGIQGAFIHGPFPRNPKHLKGGVGIMVVGAPDLAELDEIILQVGEKLGRPVVASSLTVGEFRERMNAGEALVKGILKEPKIMLIDGTFLANPGSTYYNDG